MTQKQIDRITAILSASNDILADIAWWDPRVLQLRNLISLIEGVRRDVEAGRISRATIARIRSIRLEIKKVNLL